MVVVAIIGLLASVAMASYQNYVDNAAASAVNSNYSEAVRVTRNQIAAAQARVATGLDGGVTAPDNVADWLAIINPQNRTSPAGAVAFAAGAGDAVTGVIGVAVTGSLAGGNLQVTIARPAYLSLSAQTETITQTL